MILQNSSMKITFDSCSGAITSVKARKDTKDMEYVLNAAQFPGMDVPRNRWLGHLFLRVSTAEREYEMWTGEREMHVCGSTEEVTVVYPALPGRCPVRITETFAMTEEGLRWKILLKNEGAVLADIRTMKVPLPMNQYFCRDDSYKYEKCVLRHSCLCGENAWIYWQSSSGNSPILAMKAMNHTHLEYFETEKEETVFSKICQEGEAFEGIYYVFPWFEKTLFSGGRENICLLSPGEECQAEFLLQMLGSLDELKQWLSGNGGFFLTAVPGMVLPVGEKCCLLVDASEPIRVQTEDTGDVVRIRKRAGETYLLEFVPGGYGRRRLVLETGGLVSTLTFFGIEKPKEIFRQQAEFISEKQFEREQTDPCWHGLLMWDMKVRGIIDSRCNPHGPDWFAGGSDEIGLVSGLFLSEKNRYRPVEKEIRVLDRYCRDFIEERLTEMPGDKIHRMVPWYTMFDSWKGHGADDIWRAFNYVHVINTFYNMYRIASLYNYGFLEHPKEYLKKAWRYSMAMFRYWMFPNGVGAREYGNMGEHVLVLELLPALKAEGMEAEAEQLERLVLEKANYFSGKRFPYGSEMAYDSTAYEAVYAYGCYLGDQRVMKDTVRVALANRGWNPVWYLYGTDLRQMGESQWNVSYMTQLGAWTFYHWALEQRHYDTELLLAWYASYLAGFSLFNSGGCWSDAVENRGASAWIVHGEYGEHTGYIGQEPVMKGAVAMSGESALGYFAALKIASAVVMDSETMGEVCLGCVRGDTSSEYLPQDGLGMRFFDLKRGWAVKLESGELVKVEVFSEKIQLQITACPVARPGLRFYFRLDAPAICNIRSDQETLQMNIGKTWSKAELLSRNGKIEITKA